MKIYTRAGDDGSTGLLGAGRVSKASTRVEAYGTVDELNASLGVAIAIDREGLVSAELSRVQHLLFRLGAMLASTPEAAAKLTRVVAADAASLEAWIDRLELDLAPLRRFILPGGSPLAAQLHLARTVCRRAERRVVSLASVEPVDAEAIRFLNRLSDLLFVLARWCNARAGTPETEWGG